MQIVCVVGCGFGQEVRAGAALRFFWVVENDSHSVRRNVTWGWGGWRVTFGAFCWGENGTGT